MPWGSAQRSWNQTGLPIRMAEMNVDAFDRVRTSNPASLFTSVLTYTATTIYWQQAITGTGTVTDVQNSSAALLTVGNDPGDQVVRNLSALRQPSEQEIFV